MGANDYIPKPFNADITRARVRTHVELKRSNDRRKSMIDELQNAQRMQESFYRIVSHDLKGPLTNIRMAQSILRELTEDNPSVSEILDNVDVTVQDMQEMIRMFLDVSALQSGKLQTYITTVNAHSEFIAATERLMYVAERKNVTLEVEPTNLCVAADARLLGQILTNLVSNALKFSPEGATVRMWTEIERDYVVLCVSDQGPGVPLAEQPFLFQMFRQLSTRGEGMDAGHGLGLWIVSQLGELMHGYVGYRPAPTGGSIFEISLPYTKCP